MLTSHRPKIGAKVQVHANNTTYVGILVGMSESEIYLKSPTRTWTIELSKVRSIKYL